MYKHPGLNKCSIRSARLLPSEDWRLKTHTAGEAEIIKHHRADWMGVVGSKAYPPLPTFGVVVDGIPTNSMKMDDQVTVIEELKQADHRLLQHKNTWNVFCLSKISGKINSSIVIEFWIIRRIECSHTRRRDLLAV